MDWERLKQVFQEALQQPPAARPAFLDAACGRDTSLRREVDVQGVPGQGNLGDTQGALKSHAKALAIREALGPGDPRDRRALAASLLKVGDLQAATGRSQAALASYRRALELLGDGQEGGTGFDLDRAAALTRLGRGLFAAGDTPASIGALQRSLALYEAALARLEDARAIREELLLRDPSNADRAQLLATVHAAQGDAWAARAGRASVAAAAAPWREARDSYARGLAALEALRARGPLPDGLGR